MHQENIKIRFNMKRIIQLALLATIIASCTKAPVDQSGYPITPVSFTAVKVTPNSFWGQRLQASRDVTIPLAFSKCESEHRYDNFLQAAEHIKDSTKVFPVTTGFPFDDTDPYKTLEGAAYLMQTHPNATINGEPIDQYCDRVIDIIASAQEPDGYLYTVRTMNPEHPHSWSGAKRWESVEAGSHELYNLGHLCEAAVAHYNATGKRNLLDVAIRFADCVCREIGPGEGQIIRVPGHQIAEMGLAKLYLATGDKKYLDEAKFFLDMRGKTERKDRYSQADKPVVEQTEAWGHAVRAGYMYAGMADVAALTGDESYIHAVDAIWNNIVSKKLYITGGVGSTGNGEAFEGDYILPNMTAYCETCAAIANVYVNYRLFLLHGESKYYDVLERSLYNAVISGISLDGGGFFYPNPLESMGQHQRQSWFGCACCPSNACRFIPSVPGYMYAVRGDSVYVNLFNSSTVELKVRGKDVELEQETDYPWDGTITLKVKKNKAGRFNLKVRYPGWARGEAVPSDLYTFVNNQEYLQGIYVNGENIIQRDLKNPPYLTEDGYISIPGDWKKGDEFKVQFRMDTRFIRANEQVEADRGKAAIQRGPLVYCAEWPDNDFDVLTAVISGDSSRDAEKGTITIKTTPANQDDEVEEQTYPIVRISMDAQAVSNDEKKNATRQNVVLNLIPYYAWAHRGRGNMAVWLSTY